MPPRVSIWPACRTLAIRPARPLHISQLQFQQQQSQQQSLRLFAASSPSARRGLTDNIGSRGRPPSGASGSNDAAELDAFAMALMRTRQAAREARDSGSGAAAQQQTTGSGSEKQNEKAMNQLQRVAYGLSPFDPAVQGHKYGLPELPLPSPMHMKYRYDPVVAQLTRLLMWDGKLSKAQRDMAMILNHLRTAPPPKTRPDRPLVPGSPPAAHLPLNPVQYLTVAIDSVAPLIRIRSFKGLAGGGQSLDVPVPLAVRQRRRTAFQWILDVVNKKAAKGSGRAMFPTRVAEEIVAVVEGRSGVWDKRQLVHKLGTAARANLNHVRLRAK